MATLQTEEYEPPTSFDISFYVLFAFAGGRIHTFSSVPRNADLTLIELRVGEKF